MELKIDNSATNEGTLDGFRWQVKTPGIIHVTCPPSEHEQLLLSVEPWNSNRIEGKLLKVNK